MGNILSEANLLEDLDPTKADLQWIATQNAMIFNEDFLSEAFSKLPPFSGTEEPEKEEEEKGDAASRTQLSGNNEKAIRNLIDLIVPVKAQALSVTDFKELGDGEGITKTPYGHTLRMRLRLMLRLHLAMLRQNGALGADDTKVGKKADIFRTAAKGTAVAAADPEALLNTLAVRSTLTLAARLRGADPALFSELCQNLMVSLASAPALSLQKVVPESPEWGMVQAFRSFATGILSDANASDAEKGNAISLLFALGMARGSVADLIAVCNALVANNQTLPFDGGDSLDELQARLLGHTNSLQLSLPTEAAMIEGFSLRGDEDAQESCGKGYSRPTSIAADGPHLYVLTERRAGYTVLKVGSGQQGSVAGAVLAKQDNLLAQLAEKLGRTAPEGDKKGRWQLVAAAGYLYVHDSALLSNQELAEVDPETLELKGIVSLPPSELDERIEQVVSKFNFGAAVLPEPSSEFGQSPESLDLTQDWLFFTPGNEARQLVMDLGQKREVTRLEWKATCSVATLDVAEDSLDGFITIKEVGTMDEEATELSGEEPLQGRPMRYLKITVKARPPTDGSQPTMGVCGLKVHSLCPPARLFATEGRHLVVITPKLFSLHDPLAGMAKVAVKRAALGTVEDLGGCQALTNGSQLNVLTVPPCNKENHDAGAQTSSYLLDLDQPDEDAKQRWEKFEKTRGFPQAYAYDASTNLVFGWNPVHQQICCWRNDGLAPSFEPPRPPAHELIHSQAPGHRFEALCALEASPGVAAAKVLCQLDRLASPYQAKEDETQDQDQYKVSVISIGREFKGDIKPEMALRGVNMAQQDENTFNLCSLTDDMQISQVKNYNYNGNVPLMLDWIEGLPKGTYVLVQTNKCSFEDPDTNKMFMQGMVSLGYDYSPGNQDKTKKLTAGDCFGLIGRKGSKPGTAAAKLVKSGQKCLLALSQYLPLRALPLAIEVTPDTMNGLVDLVLLRGKELTGQAPLGDVDKSFLLSTMRLLGAHLHQLRLAVDREGRTSYFDAAKLKEFKKLMLEVVDHPPIGETMAALADEAVHLFTSAMGVLYPSTEERCILLGDYLHQYTTGDLSEFEARVLALLLKRLSSAESLSLLMQQSAGAGDSRESGPAQLFANLLDLVTDVTCKRLQNTNTGEAPSGIIQASEQMMTALLNQMLSQICHRLQPSEEKLEGEVAAKKAKEVDEAYAELNSIVDAISTRAARMLDLGLQANGSSVGIDPKISKILSDSPLRSLMPTVAAVVMYLANNSKVMDPSRVFVLGGLLGPVQRALAHMINKLPSDLRVKKAVGGAGKKTVQVVMESPHQYQNNMHDIKKLCIPKAKTMTIEFDSQSRTENGYDYVQFFKDEACTQKMHPQDKFHGRGGDQNWPGCDGREPLVLEGDTAYVLFHTDGSNTDWGWKFTATAKVGAGGGGGAGGLQPGHWLVDLERTVTACGAYLAGFLLIGTEWGGAKEEKYENWLNDDLLQQDLEVDDLSEEDNAFLISLGERSPGSLGEIFCKKMKRVVLEDKGQVEDVNRAVYYTCAALIKQSGLVHDAIALAEGKRDKPSDGLKEAWKAGQKMRQFFSFGDLGRAVDTSAPPTPMLERGPSAFAGADSKAVNEIAARVTQKALFVLSLKKAQHATTDSQAKKRWNLLSAFAKGQKETKAFEGIDKLVAVVQQAVAADDLKHIFAFRRKTAQRFKKKLNTSEKVLKFCQSFVDSNELASMVSSRDERAQLRAKGLALMTDLVEHTGCEISLSLALSLFSQYVRATPKEDSVGWAHYMVNVLGCSFSARQALTEQYQIFLGAATRRLSGLVTTLGAEISAEGKGPTPASIVAIDALGKCVEALGLDYTLTDHHLLEQSGLAGALEPLLAHPQQEVKGRAWALLELLLVRCVGLQGLARDQLAVEGLSGFSQKLVAILTKQLEASTNGLHEYLALEGTDRAWRPESVEGGAVLLAGIAEVSPLHAGRVAPHLALGGRSSVSLWFCRAPGDEALLARKKFEQGDKVRRGPGWKGGKEDEKVEKSTDKIDRVGEVTKVTDEKVEVKWNTSSSSCSYVLPKTDDEKCPISLVDPNMGGVLFSKGALRNLSEEEADQPWGQYGLFLRGDATVGFEASQGRDSKVPFTVHGLTPLQAGKWVHLAIVLTGDRAKLYVDGELDSSAKIPSAMASAKPGAQTIESEHPYPTNSTKEWTVEVAGAKSYTVVFDERSCTESSDRIKFTLADGTSVGQGYSGGRNGQDKTFPGVGAEPPLVIQASKFKVAFTSGDVSDWGFKFKATPSMKSETTPLRVGANCPGSHGLTEFPTPVPGWYCSGCFEKTGQRSLVPAGTTFYGCRTCDFDLCTECKGEREAQASAGRAAADSSKSFLYTGRVEASILRPDEPRVTMNFEELIISSVEGVRGKGYFNMDSDSDSDSDGPSDSDRFHMVGEMEGLTCNLTVKPPPPEEGGPPEGTVSEDEWMRFAITIDPILKTMESESVHPSDEMSGAVVKWTFLDDIDECPTEEQQFADDQEGAGGPEPEVLDEGKALNRLPFYLGQAPSYAAEAPAAAGQLAHAAAYGCALTKDQLEALRAEGARPEGVLPANVEGRIVEVLALMLKTVVEMTPSSMERFVQPDVLERVLLVLLKGPPKAAAAATAVAQKVLPVATVASVNNQLAKVLGGSASPSLIETLLSLIGAELCPWSGRSPSVGSEDALSVADAYVGLVRELVGISSEWGEALVGASERLLNNFQVNQADTSTVHTIAGMLATCGGNFEALRIGSSALLDAGDGALPEECTVVGFTSPPTTFDGKDKEKKEKLWKDCKWGDAVVVSVHSDPGSHRVVAQSQLAARTLAFPPSFQDFLMKTMARLEPLLTPLLQLPTSDPSVPVYGPKVERGEVALEFESEHDYPNSADTYTEVEVEGAEELEVTFDPQSRTEEGCDFVRFCHVGSTSEFYSYSYGSVNDFFTTFSGRGGSENWPGTGDRPPLKIPAGAFRIYFHSDGSNTDWGYKIYVKGVGVKTTRPPEVPPSETQVAACFLRAQAMRVVSSLVGASDKFLASMTHLAPELMKASLAEVGSGSGDGGGNIKPQTFESNHPYNNGMDRYEDISIPGASKLIIEFDDQTRTESGCDYIIFYTDSDRQTRINQENYSGGKDGSSSNWPGMGGRPPLEIEGDSCHFWWHTDGSVNDWGWIFKVTPKYAGGGDQASSAAEATFQLASLGALLRDGPASQKVPSPEAFHGFPIKKAHAKGLAEVQAALEAADGAEEEKGEIDEEETKEIEGVEVDVPHLFGKAGKNKAGFKYDKGDGKPSGEYLNPEKSQAVEDHAALFGLSAPSTQQGQISRLLAAFSDAANQASMLYARAAIVQFLAHWPKGTDFNVASLGSPEEVILLMKTMYEKKENPMCKQLLGHLEKRIVQFVHHDSVEGRAFASALVTFSLNNLKSTKGVAMPKARASGSKVFESGHNYENNEDKDFEVSFPGAKQIMIVFDPQTRTENGCDWLRFYKSKDHDNPLTDNISGQSQNWPGVADKEPLFVDGNSCWVQWHTDGSNTDWGYKFTASGIMEVPSTEAIEAYLGQATKLEEGAPVRDLSKWILQLISKEKVPVVREALFYPSALSILLGAFKSSPDEGVMRSVCMLFASMFKDTSDVDMNPEVVGMLRKIANAVKSRFNEEAQKGDKSEGLMQTLLHSGITLLNALDSIAPGSDDVDKTKAKAETGALTFNPDRIGRTLETKDSRKTVTAIDDSSSLDKRSMAISEQCFQGKGKHVWILKATTISPGYAVGVVKADEQLDMNKGTRDQQPGSFFWEFTGSIIATGQGEEPPPEPSYGQDIKLVSGDRVDLELDLGAGTITFSRNKVRLGLAVGPPGSGAALEVDNPFSEGAVYHAAVVLQAKGDSFSFIRGEETENAEDLLPRAKQIDPFKDPTSSSDPMAQFQSSVNYLEAISQRSLPQATISKYFTAKIVEESSATLPNSYMDGAEPFEHEVHVPGARALRVRFDAGAKMGPEDALALAAPTLPAPLEFRGVDGARLGHGDGLQEGDKVVRGPHWDQSNRGMEDGSKGGIGIVQHVMAHRDPGPEGAVYFVLKSGRYKGQTLYANENSRCLTVEPVGSCTNTSVTRREWVFSRESGLLTLIGEGDDKIVYVKDTNYLYANGTASPDSLRVWTLSDNGVFSLADGRQLYLDHEKWVQVALPGEAGNTDPTMREWEWISREEYEQRSARTQADGSWRQLFGGAGLSDSAATDEPLEMETPAADLRAGGAALTGLRAACSWKDQGWGNQKGRVWLRVVRGGETVADWDLFGVAPHELTPAEWVLRDRAELGKVLPGDRLKVFYRVGGGGGHALEIRDLAVWAMEEEEEEEQETKNAGGFVDVKWLETGKVEERYQYGIKGKYDIQLLEPAKDLAKEILIKGDRAVVRVVPARFGASWDQAAKRPTGGPQVAAKKPTLLQLSGETKLRLPRMAALPSDFTFEAWVRPETGGSMVIASQYDEDTTGRTRAFFLLLKGDGRIELHLSNDGMEEVVQTEAGAAPAGRWTHVAARCGGGAAALVADGEERARARGRAFENPRHLGEDPVPFYIGGSSHPDYDANFKGSIYDVRIWNLPLPTEDISSSCKVLPPRGSDSLAVSCPLINNSLKNIIGEGVLETDGPEATWTDLVPHPTKFEYAERNAALRIEPVFDAKTLAGIGVSDGPMAKKYMAFVETFNAGSEIHDLSLLSYVNAKAKKKGYGLDQMLSIKWSELAPSEEDLVRNPKLNELVQMAGTPWPEEEDAEQSEGKPAVKWPSPVEARFNILQGLNTVFRHLYSYVDFGLYDKPWSLAAMILRCKGLLLEVLKREKWESAMQHTEASGSEFDLKLSRSKAKKHASNGRVDHEGRNSVFGQAFRQMHPKPAGSLRRSGKLYNCIFMGERSVDAGGPYRESWSMYAQELMSDHVPMLLRSPNGRHAIGYNRDKFMPHPGSTSTTHLEMFVFLGKLFGMAIRTKEYLAVNIAPACWKLLGGEQLTPGDLEEIDHMAIQSLNSLREIEKQGVDESTFEDVIFETFTTMSSDDREVELKLNGAEIPVTFQNRHEYCDLVLRYRLHEFDKQVAAMRQGLGTMVPLRLLGLFTPGEVEALVCGAPELDLPLLKQSTEYSGVSESDQHVRFFWDALESFSNEERQMFLRFTWGRTRLPMTLNDFPQRFKVQAFNSSPADQYYPVSHTCFFSLELPRYSTLDIMKEKLRYAIYNCQEIDGDGETSAGMSAATLWEDF